MIANDVKDELLRMRAEYTTRRHFLGQCSIGLGCLALGQLQGGFSARAESNPLFAQSPVPRPRVKNIIYVHLVGSPPQHELFDYKPELVKYHMKPCPAEMLQGRQFAFIKGTPNLLGPLYRFRQYGQSGAWFSELLPHLSQHADELCFVKSMFTDQFNHAPAQLLLLTGNPQFGGASIGSWVAYGLGSSNQDLPSYIVMVSGGKQPDGGKSLWGSSYLPSVYQGVQCRSDGDPVLYVSDPPGMPRDIRWQTIQALNQLNELDYATSRDPEIKTRISQYELAFRMQMSVPNVMEISAETASTLDMYGAAPGKSSFANNCLLARRLVEQGVRFVQLFDWGWDIHGTSSQDDLVNHFPKKCHETDRPIAALIADLKQRGMLDDTLVVCGGEFGRTAMNEARNGSVYLGRDHHPDCFTVWLAGGGTRAGLTFGQTDALGYAVAENPVHVRDLQATILHALGLDPYRLSFPFQGLDQRLIGPSNQAVVRQDLFA